MKRFVLAKILSFAAVFAGFAVDGQAENIKEFTPVIADLKKSPLLVTKPQAETPFSDQEKIVQELYDLFLFDLAFADAFQIYPEPPQAVGLIQQDKQNNTFDYAQWKQLKFQDAMPEYVVETVLVPKGEGKFQLNLLVYDLVDGKRAIGTAYGADPHPPFGVKDLRRAGHRATAQVISELTNGLVEPITETKIAFVNHNSVKRIKELFLIDYDGWKDSLIQLTYFNSITIFPDWSPDGADLAYVSFKSEWPDCFIQNIATGKVFTLAKFMGTNTTPRWYPDGQNLALSLSAPGNQEIYRIPRAGGKPVRLTHTNDDSIDEAPDISPDGNQIAFTSDRNGKPQIYVMDANGANIRRISYVDGGQRKCDTPQWSPVPIDNKKQNKKDYRIAFTGFFDSLQSDVFSVWQDGSDLQMISEHVGENLNASWSPNGKYIAYASNRLGKYDIFITPSEPGRLIFIGDKGMRNYRVTYLGGDNLSPAWSPK